MLMQNYRFLITILVTAILLLIHSLAMFFTDEVNCILSDFIIASIFLFGAGFLVELVRKKIKNKKHRKTIYIFLFVVFLLTWVELAVGLFGTPFAGS